MASPIPPVVLCFSPKMSAYSLHPKLRGAFSLVELLVVITIMVTAIALLGPATSTMGKSAALNKDGLMVESLINSARQNSLSKNATTALVVVTDPSVETQNRMFTMLELLPPANGQSLSSSDWKQLSKWETLSPHVIVKKWETQGAPNAITAILPSKLNYGGQSISQFNAMVFMPDGSTNSDSPTVVQLVEGYYPKGSSIPCYTNGTSNYYQLTVLNATGRIKVDRP